MLLWEAGTGRDFLAIQAHPSAVACLGWRSDSKLLATGCEDGQIRLWDSENGTQVKGRQAHGGGVLALGFTRDGRIVSVGRDKTPKLWKADGSQKRAFEACADAGLAIALCGETGRLVVGDWTGELRVFTVADGGRVGTLDPNPPSLAERVAAAERALADAKTKLDEATVALAAAPDAEKAKAEAAVIDLKNQVARAAASHATWLAEVAFQAGHDRMAKLLADRQAAVQAAESECGVVEGKRRADEQAAAAAAAKRDGLQKQAAEIAAAMAQAQQQAKDLAATIAQQKAEIAKLQGDLPAATAATADAEAAGKALAEAAKAAEEKKAAIAARQAEADATAKELDALQAGAR